ncbi:MAG: hypothetical protein QOE11_349 [Solirubrobacteraceae bacterium]|jgi:hypothetical protein|nr:hypothetical protein [Solirubrobacteraceae bacterium]
MLSPPRPPSTRPRTIVRLTVALAIVLLFGSAAAIVVAGPMRHHRLAPQDVHYIHARLVDFDQGVRTQLVRITPARGLSRAQLQTRDALAGVNALARAVDGAAGHTTGLLQVAIADELRFLDATGSVLTNPRSSRIKELPALDVAARRSLAAMPGTRPRRRGGVNALLRLRKGQTAVAAPAA